MEVRDLILSELASIELLKIDEKYDTPPNDIESSSSINICELKGKFYVRECRYSVFYGSIKLFLYSDWFEVGKNFYSSYKKQYNLLNGG